MIAAHPCCDGVAERRRIGSAALRTHVDITLSARPLDLRLRSTLDAVARDGRAASRTSIARPRLVGRGPIALAIGRYAEALQHLEESLAHRARAIGASCRRRAAATGQAVSRRGDTSAARAYLDEALDLARASGDNALEIAAALSELEHLYRLEGASTRRRLVRSRACRLARELGDRESIAVGLAQSGQWCDIARARRARNAHAPLREVLGDSRSETGSRSAAQSSLDVCAGLAALRSEFEIAARFHGGRRSLALANRGRGASRPTRFSCGPAWTRFGASRTPQSFARGRAIRPQASCRRGDRGGDGVGGRSAAHGRGEAV